MSVALTRADVQRIAALARLALTADEVDLFARQLGDILSYVEQIREIETAGVPPTTHVLNRPVDREDALRPSLSRDAALANAPDASPQSGLYKVPRVLA
jgi:aspartyl-tRNA(Asn)/glutamyl-tRNA(Gln) amidotransferase subunit C